MRRVAGFILPMVLVIIGLLATMMAGFIFFVRAETAGSAAHADAQQARLAAESGLEEVIVTLRQAGHDATAWYDAPQRFRHKLVWSADYDREHDSVEKRGTREEILAQRDVQAAWRFSVVTDAWQEPAGREDARMRFGLTPEAGKLHLNHASEDQLRSLLVPLLTDLEVENAEELLAALLDWRDADSDIRENGAENEYYNTLEPPYSAKNGPFDSIEELLLVKGFSAAILYGEDVNRNGILDPNEDDGDRSFPFYDNQDGILNRGIAPFLTVWTREPDVSLDNRPRINLNQDAATIMAQVESYFAEAEREACQGAINYILQLKAENFDFRQLASPAQLYQGIDGPMGGAGGTGALANSSVTLAELPYVLDRFSTRAPGGQQSQSTAGLININTAPARVLAVIPGMPPEGPELIVDVRAGLDAELARTPAWLLMTATSEVIDLAAFHAMAPYITTKAYQFHVEVLGYADHTKTLRRYEWIIEMMGPLAQVRYWRDLTALGPAWPIDDKEIAGEGVEVRSGG